MKKTAIQRINLLIDMAETLENYFLAKELKEIKKELTNKNK
jgi:hypothetical protein